MPINMSLHPLITTLLDTKREHHITSYHIISIQSRIGKRAPQAAKRAEREEGRREKRERDRAGARAAAVTEEGLKLIF